MTGFRILASGAVALLAVIASAGNWHSSIPARAGEGDLKLVRVTLARSLSAPFIWASTRSRRKIGRPPGTYGSILFTLAAEINTVDLSKVNLVNTTAAGPAELQALKNSDLDSFVLWSPVIDRAVVDGYGYYPDCCDIGSTKEFGAGN